MAQDWWEKGQRGEAFRLLQEKITKAEEEPRLEPVKNLVEAGITTARTLEFRAAERPPVAEPAPTPNDPQGWDTARREAIAARSAEIAKDRAVFHDRSTRMREIFNEHNGADGSHER